MAISLLRQTLGDPPERNLPMLERMRAAVRLTEPTAEQDWRLSGQRDAAWRMAETWTGHLWGERSLARVVRSDTAERVLAAGAWRPFAKGQTVTLHHLDPETWARGAQSSAAVNAFGYLPLPAGGVWELEAVTVGQAGNPPEDVLEAILRIVGWLFAGSLPVPSPTDGAALTRAGVVQKSGAAEILRHYKEIRL